MVTNPALLDDWQGEPLLVHFFIPVPWPTAIPAGLAFTFDVDEDIPWPTGLLTQSAKNQPALYRAPQDGGSFVAIRTMRFEVDDLLSSWQTDAAFGAYGSVYGKGNRRGPDTTQPIKRDATVFEVETPLAPRWNNGKIDPDRAISDCFDQCLSVVNELLRAYSVATKDYRVHALNRYQVASLIPRGVYQPGKDELQNLGMFLVNEHFGAEVRAGGGMSVAEVERVVVAASRSRQAREADDPAMAYVLLARRAERAIFIEYDFPAGVVWSYASIESLLNGMLIAMAWESGVPSGDTAKWFRCSLKRRMVKCMKTRIGGGWDTRDAKGAFGRWNSSVAQLRHRVIHAGYVPTDYEAREALDASSTLESYAKELLANASDSYLRTAAIFLGLPGLKRYDVLDAG